MALARTLLLVSLCARAALAAAAVPSGTPVQVWPCNASSERQVWRVAGSQVLLGGANGVPDQGLVLNTLGFSNASKGVLNAWTNVHNNAQAWVFSPTSGLITSDMNGLCVGTVNASGSAPLPAGTAVVQVPCAGGSDAVRWTLGADNVLRWGRDPTLCLDAGSSVSCADPAFCALPYCDASLPATARASDLLARLSDDELASLLTTSNNGVPRLGVPALEFGEALHGVLVGCGAPYTNGSYTSTGCPTSFPTGLATGASFNRSLVQAVGDVIGKEARALHNQGQASSVFFAPDLNPFRDPRWGRGMEVSGEDPLLMAEWAANFVQGFQGNAEGGPLGSGYVRSVSMAKHGFSYDQEGNGGPHDRTHFCATVSLADLVRYHWPGFKSALQRGKAGGVMCAANGYNGAASCAHGEVNNGVLRDEWGADFALVTDGNGVGYLYQSYGHGAQGCVDGATGPTNAVRVGLRGGVDVELGSTLNSYALAAIADGNIVMDDILTALMRTVPMIFRLGLVDSPALVPFAALGPSDVDTPEHRQLALEAAQQAVILLRNNASAATGAPLLPLSLAALKAANKSLALIGFSASDPDVQLANYHGPNELAQTHTPLLVLQSRATAAGVELHFAIGCVDGAPCNDTSGFAEAVATAQSAGVAIVFCGLAPSNGGGAVPGKSEGEELDRDVITLPGQQEQLIAVITATGTPVVLVVVRGGAVALSDALYNDLARVPAVLHVPYNGELGGDGIADVLLGDVSPSGRLTTTQYPASIVTRSIIDYNMSSGDGITYQYYTGVPQWPFGAGGSYTTFSLLWQGSEVVEVDATDWALGLVRAPFYSVNITNVGDVTSDVSVLAFVDGDGSDSGAPLTQLFDFQRVAALAPGTSATLIFTVPLDIAATVAEDGSTSLRASEHRRVRIGLPGLPDVERMVFGSLRLKLAEGRSAALSRALPLR